MSKLDIVIINHELAAQKRLMKRLAKSRRYDSRRVSLTKKSREMSDEARSNHIALGFLRNRTMDEIELPLRARECGHIYSKNMTRTAPNWERVEEIVLEHGISFFANEQEMLQRFAEFRDGQEEIFIDHNTIWE